VGGLGWNRDIEERVEPLLTSGLVERTREEGNIHYGLTASGRVFLNKLKYEELRPTSGREQAM
jgi:predicted transcriptional regulator